MYFDTKSIGGGIEILASNDYQAVPVTVKGDAVVKAGMPMKNSDSNTVEKTEDGSDAIGILLYDVDPSHDPNGSVVVDGIINWDKCKTSVGQSLSIDAATIAKALPNIVFRDKDGKTYNSAGAGA